MYRTVEMIKEAYDAGERLEYIFFWGHQPSMDGNLTKSCLSQWWACCFEVEGTVYSSSEQFMMAEKARLFGDTRTLGKILSVKDPKEVKALGREVAHFHEEKWQQYCEAIVYRGNMAKFSQNPLLKEYLLSTKGCLLVEASPYDKIWGIGLSEETRLIENPHTWEGENLLGFTLMGVREALE